MSVDREAGSGLASDDNEDVESDDLNDESDSSDAANDNNVHSVIKKTEKWSKQTTKAGKSEGKDGFEIVPAEEPATKMARLDAEGLALGEELIKSSKRRRELEEESFNR